MKRKINLKKLLFGMSMFMPTMYAMFSCIGTSLANKVIIMELVVAYIILNTVYIKKHKKLNFLVFNFLFFVYSIYNSFLNGFSFLTHYYFYSFLLMFIIFSLFLEDDVRHEFLEYFFQNKKIFFFSFFVFILTITYSCIFANGIRMEFSSSIPILYGPFGIPHSLAYTMLIFYCAFSLYDFKGKNKFLLLLKLLCFVIVILTAVRSATIAIIILMLFDFVSYKGMSKKIGLIIIGVWVFTYLYYFTDFLYTNPLVSKSIAASDSGSISNGREIYRQVIFDYYLYYTNIVEKILGIGMNGVLDAMYNSIRVHIHAHNDYVNILAGYGLVGFLLMIYNQLKLGTVCRTKFAFLFFQLFIFILSYYNGFAIYVIITASFPIILCFFEEKNKNYKNQVIKNKI